MDYGDKSVVLLTQSEIRVMEHTERTKLSRLKVNDLRAELNSTSGTGAGEGPGSADILSAMNKDQIMNLIIGRRVAEKTAANAKAVQDWKDALRGAFVDGSDGGLVAAAASTTTSSSSADALFELGGVKYVCIFAGMRTSSVAKRSWQSQAMSRFLTNHLFRAWLDKGSGFNDSGLDYLLVKRDALTAVSSSGISRKPKGPLHCFDDAIEEQMKKLKLFFVGKVCVELEAKGSSQDKDSGKGNDDEDAEKIGKSMESKSLALPAGSIDLKGVQYKMSIVQDPDCSDMRNPTCVPAWLVRTIKESGDIAKGQATMVAEKATINLTIPATTILEEDDVKTCMTVYFLTGVPQSTQGMVELKRPPLDCEKKAESLESGKRKRRDEAPGAGLPASTPKVARHLLG